MPNLGAWGLQTGSLLHAERSAGFRAVAQFDVAVECSQCRGGGGGGGREDRVDAARLASLRRNLVSRFAGKGVQSGDRMSGYGFVTAMATRDSKGKESTGDSQILDSNWTSGVDLRSNPAAAPMPSDADASWEQLSMAFRIAYSTAMYGGLAFAGHVICGFTGVDLWGDFNLSPQVITTGFGYAVPPMMALLFILEDEIVKTWSPARAIRDVEDEELLDFFSGMSPWQFPFVVAAGAVAEELFFRVAIQGGLTHALQMSDKGVTESTVGLASLTGLIPLFVPFAQFFATALTAALTSSMYYVMTSPKDPKYVVAPVIRGRNNRGDIRERVSAWYERRQQKKIYSPLMEGLLAMYLGFEWMHTGNILAPIITHTLYSLVVVGNGLRRIHDNREKLRQRVNKISGERLARIGVTDKSRME